MNKFFSLLLILLSISCSKEVEKSVINEKSLDLQVLEAYKEGIKALEGGDVLFAAKKFNEAEILFPQSDWAPRAALMAAYAYYSQDYYADAIAELTRYIKIYPQYKNEDYAYYLLAICYYEQIVDETKDLESIINAKKNFEIVIKKFPDTEFALDS
jgi:outer membrane protein assembly factor BamD